MRRIGTRLRAALPGGRLASSAGVVSAASGQRSGLAGRFARYVEWLTAEGYDFRAFGREMPDLAPSVVYLRYDTAPGGLAAARRLAEQHQRLRVPGTFALAWDLIAANPRLAAGFAELRKLDPEFVHFGLYCAPVENFLCRRRFGGDTRRQADFLASAAVAGFLDRMTAEEVADIGAGAAEQLRTEAEAFAAAFGKWPAVAGRSGVWSAAFAKERARSPELAWLDKLFHPVRFLAELDLGDYGFGPEAASLPGDEQMGPHIMFGGGDPEKVRRNHHQRVWGGAGFVAIFPPTAWTQTGFDQLTEPPPIPNPQPVSAPAGAPILTNLEDLVPLGRRCERLDGDALAAAARQRVGPWLEPLFRRFVEWLRGEGYVFAGLDQRPPDFGARRVYLRYDVHIQDLLPAYVLADLHRQLAIPGSFQLNWRFSRAERQLEPFFLKFSEFDPDFVQLGLHCAPAASWFVDEHCSGDLKLAERLAERSDLEDYARSLLAAYRRAGHDADELQHLRAAADAHMTALADSFRSMFGERQTVSGHGNFLAAAFARLHVREPAFAPLYPYFNAVGYLQAFGVARFGFARELTSFPGEPRDPPCVILEGGDQGRRRGDFHCCVERGHGFLCLFHPATLTSDNLAAILPPPA